MTMQVVIIGVGNAWRGDDAAGLLVARRLAKEAPAAIHVREHGGEAASLVEMLRDASRVVIVDAMVSGRPAGTIATLSDAGALRSNGWSTHGHGVQEALRLADALGWRPDSVALVGIEGACFDTGALPSPAMEQAVDRAAEVVLQEALCTS